MKTIIIKGDGNRHELNQLIHKIEKYTDKTIKGAFICTRLLTDENYNTVLGELKDAYELDDYDIFLIGVIDTKNELTPLKNVNKAKTLICELTDYESIKNYVVIL